MKTTLHSKWTLALVIPVMLFMSGCYIQETPCYYGVDGRPGRAFFGLDWTGDKPSYLWTNNTAIPHVFEYGSYYQSYVGSYELYYEGTFIDGCCPSEYYWDVHFDVWAHPGTPGGCGFDGMNGADSYLMFTCGPYGPVEGRINKTNETSPVLTVMSRTDETVVCEVKDGDLTMVVTFNKLKASRRTELDPKGEIIAR